MYKVQVRLILVSGLFYLKILYNNIYKRFENFTMERASFHSLLLNIKFVLHFDS